MVGGGGSLVKQLKHRLQAGSRDRELRGCSPVSSLDLRASLSLQDDDVLNLLSAIDTLQYVPLSWSPVMTNVLAQRFHPAPWVS